MNKPLSYEEIAELDEELCKYCTCTELGLEMGAQRITAYSFGCERMYCKEAYERYLEEYEEEE